MRKAPKKPVTKKAAGKPATRAAAPDLGMSLEELRELEAKAVRLEKLAQVLLNTPQQAFYLYDYREQRFVLGQEHVSGLYGYKPGEVEKLAKGWFSIIHPNDLDEFQTAHLRLMHSRRNEVQSIRTRVLRKNGGYEWIQAYMRPFERDAEGKVVSEVGMVVIITPLMEAEQALRETEARCHSLFQHNTAGVLVFDADFHIVDANPAVCRMLGHDKKSLLRLSVLDVTAPGVRTEMHQMLRTMKSRVKLPASFDTALDHHAGKRVEVMAAPTCLRDETGGFHQGMLILTDITQRKAVEAALKRESDLNKVLIDHAPIAIGLLDADGIILRVNSAAEKIFGFTLKEVKGKAVWTLPVMGPEEIGPSRQRFQALVKGAGKVAATLSMRTRSGETRQIETASTAVNKADGSIDFFVTTGTDVTERRKLEVEVIRVAEQEHIRIGHDLHDGIGQTLTGIAALVEALESRLSGEEQKDARRIHELMKTAIEETRRLSHGLSPAAVKNRGLAGGLMLIAETVRENFRRECVCHLDRPAPVISQETEIHLFRIAQEAVNNAIRHGGATKMHLSLRRKSTTQGILEISD
ncbi:MAG: PAS domain S-box protein, partial [Prosthecobacter sp.]|uniref:PAS domain S-box protein n=1 Tax=Prosthecobacter sp. TaxID=1965333 RepID=UPI0039039E20